MSAALFLASCAGEITSEEVEEVRPAPSHWSFFSLSHLEAPDMASDPWVKNPVDAFILRGLLVAGRSPAPPADPAKLIRRVTLSLTGLPPTLEEVDAFIADPSDEAYGALVDRLLASPRYAEHMASQWLDIARYSDSDGFQSDIPRPAWPWRDWVINAFDTNLPFDQFTIQQIAGDLLPERTDQTILATAFNRNHAIQGENGLLLNEFRDRYVTDRVETLGKTWLGLTLGCAKCHDHKFDPISAEDFFRVYDCFNQLDEFDNGPSSGFYPTVSLASPYAANLTTVLEERRAALTAAAAPQAQLAAIVGDQNAIATVAPIRVMWDSATQRETQLLALGRYDMPVGEPIHCAAPEALPPFPEGAPPNRLGLAQWLVMPNNPLTARVTVNRYWLHHFGRGIVTSVDDFGTRVDEPTNKALLDWLAQHFIESGWNLKALHRLLVTSNTYRQSSATDAAALELDPSNEAFGRGPRFRLAAEVIRDLPLAASGLLVERLGGPPAYPYQPPGLWEELAWEGYALSYPQLSGDTLYRRSVYAFWKKTLPPPLMSLFDAPDREISSAYRESAVSPQQALALLNNVQFVEAARHLAEKLLTATNNDVPLALTLGFRTVTSRAPNETELVTLTQLYEAQLAALESNVAATQALQTAGDSVPSANTSAHAAMTQVVRVLFNLGETITLE